MFHSWMLDRKLKAFRNGKVTCVDCIEEECTITLKAGWLWKASLAFKLVNFDNAVQLSFSGDAITRDGEALARVMKAVWDLKLPEFPDSDTLRVQLWGEDDDLKRAKYPIYFRDMSAYTMGMPNEVRVTTVTSYLVDN